jgi:hypothetical protein
MKLITKQPTPEKEREEEKERSIKSDEMSSHPGVWAVMSFGQTTAKAAREIKHVPAPSFPTVDHRVPSTECTDMGVASRLAKMPVTRHLSQSWPPRGRRVRQREYQPTVELGQAAAR